MSLVQWNDSKFHLLDESAAATHQDANGKVTARPSSSGRGHGFARTKCGERIGIDNQVFQCLPEKIDENQDICGKCNNGIGVANATAGAKNVHVDDHANVSAGKVKNRIHNAARALFGSST